MHPPPDFVRHSDRGSSDIGLDPTAPLVLEVTQTWGDLVLETVHLPPRSPALRVGTERFPMTDEALPFSREHVLFRWRRDRWVAVLEPGWQVRATVDGEDLDAGDLVARHAAERDLDTVRVALTAGMHLEVVAGEVTFHARLVRRAAFLDTRGSEDDDWSFAAILGLVGFVGLLFGVFVWSAPPPPTNTMTEVPDEMWAVVMQQPEPDPPPAVAAGDDGSDEAEPSESDDASEAPETDLTEKVAGGSDEGTPEDAEVVSRAGLFAAWDDAGIDALAGPGLSIDRIGDIDAGPSKMRAGPGWALTKGGGTCGHAFCTGADGSDYSDGITRGPGGRDPDYGGPADLERGPEPGIEVFDDDVITLGCLERDLVDAVVKDHLPRIRYCYQRMLQRDATLAGKVTIRFTIAKDGSVSSSTTKFSSLDNDAVEECVQERFFQMQFPKPNGCSQVIVSYPFLFSPN